MTEEKPDEQNISEEIDELIAGILTDTAEKEIESDKDEVMRHNYGQSGSRSIAQQILRVLEEDARKSYTAIVEQVNVSVPTVRKYINQLENRGIVMGYSVEVDPGSLNKRTLTILKIEIERGCFEEVTTTISELDSVYSLYALAENSAALAEIHASSFNEYSEIVSNDISMIPGVETTHTTILEERKK